MGEANGKSSAFTTKQQAIGYTHRLCVPPVDIYIYIYIYICIYHILTPMVIGSF